MDITQQPACPVVNPFTVYSYGFLFNCTAVGQASDLMTTCTFPILRVLVVYFFTNFNRTHCQQTVKISIRRRDMRRLIWVFTVCLCSIKRALSVFGLILVLNPNGFLCVFLYKIIWLGSETSIRDKVHFLMQSVCSFAKYFKIRFSLLTDKYVGENSIANATFLCASYQS